MVSEGVSDVAPAVVTKQAENSVAQGSEHMRCVARVSLVGILTHGDVSHIVDSVFDGPMATPQLLQAGCTHLSVRQAGDAMRSCSADLSCFQSEIQSLAQQRKGVGLATIQERAEMLGGRVQFESRIGRGTKVRIEIPLA